MPYIEIRAYPKDEKIKKSVAQKIENIFFEVLAGFVVPSG